MEKEPQDFIEFLLKLTGMTVLIVLAKEGVRVLQGKKFSLWKAVASFFVALLVCLLTGIWFRDSSFKVLCVAVGAAGILSDKVILALLTVNKEDLREIFIKIITKKP